MGRILMVVRPSKGGAFGHVVRLGAALLDRGHAVAVAGPHAAHAGQIPLEVIDVDMGRSVSPGADLRATTTLARVYRRYRPDIVHAHGSKGGVTARFARAATPPIPLVLTPHNFAFTNYFASRAERAVYRLIEAAVAPLATRTLCVCEAERAVAARIGPSSRLRVVHNGIDPEPPAPPRLPYAELIPKRGPILASVTEFNAPKGVPTLIEAMPRVLAEQPDARLVVAGDGPLRSQVEQSIARHGVEEAVLLLGEVPSVTDLLEGATAFVLPSWSESFPYAVLEAMRAGLPIVATAVGGVPEAVVDGEGGRLVAPHDPPALAGAILEVLSDPGAAEAMGSANQQRQRERFTFEQMVAGNLAVYRELGLE